MMHLFSNRSLPLPRPLLASWHKHKYTLTHTYLTSMLNFSLLGREPPKDGEYFGSTDQLTELQLVAVIKICDACNNSDKFFVVRMCENVWKQTVYLDSQKCCSYIAIWLTDWAHTLYNKTYVITVMILFELCIASGVSLLQNSIEPLWKSRMLCNSDLFIQQPLKYFSHHRRRTWYPSPCLLEASRSFWSPLLH